MERRGHQGLIWRGKKGILKRARWTGGRTLQLAKLKADYAKMNGFCASRRGIKRSASSSGLGQSPGSRSMQPANRLELPVRYTVCQQSQTLAASGADSTRTRRRRHLTVSGVYSPPQHDLITSKNPKQTVSAPQAGPARSGCLTTELSPRLLGLLLIDSGSARTPSRCPGMGQIRSGPQVPLMLRFTQMFDSVLLAKAVVLRRSVRMMGRQENPTSPRDVLEWTHVGQIWPLSNKNSRLGGTTRGHSSHSTRSVEELPSEFPQTQQLKHAFALNRRLPLPDLHIIFTQSQQSLTQHLRSPRWCSTGFSKGNRT
ncbi:hypothetical protein EGW08_014848 [Elysia chlorotica]|uniref:Uncharacterized protein n=1 Tax=Elysia chlorotica TaxID=188477 RepID=A0A433T722_ELYCH|nr:hypothetical protein EGW08_014848 [Elysia chlorotica]